MKARIIIFSIALLLLNSCIVKSLFPFYTKKAISFEKKLIGVWNGDDKEQWEIISFNKAYLEDRKVKNESELSKKDLEEYKSNKDGYFVTVTQDDKEATFVAMPFKVNNQLFLDFSIFDVDIPILDLAEYHLVGMHSLAKMYILPDNSIKLKWLGEERLSELIELDKVKIKYEKTGVGGSGFLLTASSEELQKFIKKYMASKDDTKWEGGENQIIVNLKKKDG